MNQLELQGIIRNTWGRYDFKASETIVAANDQCEFQPKFYGTPGRADQLVAAGAYASSQITIPAGSFIYALSHFPLASRFRFQMTDLSLGHALWNQPVENTSLLGRPWYFPELYPVISPGIFRLEFWNTLTTQGRCQMILCVAEPKS